MGMGMGMGIISHLISITVELKRDGKKLLLAVSDTGQGMPSDYSSGKATGLGMKVVNLLTRQLKGSLKLPQAGGEARFEIAIPFTAILAAQSSPKQGTKV